MVSNALQSSVDDYKDEFTDYEGFIENIDSKKYQMYTDFSDQLQEDEELIPLLSAITKLVKKYQTNNTSS
jgi:hypothetical protein